MASKRKVGNACYYTVTSKTLPKGRAYFTFDDEAEGDAYVAKLDAILKQGILPPEFMQERGSILSIADAIDQYLDGVQVPDSDQKLLSIARERVGKDSISKLDADWADKYINGMKSKDLSPSTIRHHVGALARCLDWVKRKRNTLLIYNPLRELPKRYATGHKEEELRDRRLGEDEEARVRAIILGMKPETKQRGFNFENPDEMLLLFEIALETGMRMSEIYTLDKSQIHLDSRTIFLEKTKNGDKRQVPMNSIIYKRISEYIETLDRESLFSFSGHRRDISARLSQTFGRIFEAAGCGDFTFHGLRHEATSRLYERTKLSDVEIAKILGWRSLKMALRYGNLRGSELATKLW